MIWNDIEKWMAEQTHFEANLLLILIWIKISLRLSCLSAFSLLFQPYSSRHTEDAEFLLESLDTVEAVGHIVVGRIVAARNSLNQD